MKVIFTASLLTLALGIVAQITLPDNGPLFLQDEVAVFRVILDQDSLDQMLDSDNWYSNHEYPATFIYESSLGTDTVDLVGLRLRGNTSREAGKKSFKISLNSFIPGQHFQGVEKLNLNGHQNDPSLMRTKICWDTFRNAGVLGCRTSFVKLYINDEYKGLYTNVEHIDEEYIQTYFGNNSGDLFKCLYPADLKHWGDDPDDYKEEFWGRRAYQLKTNTTADDYSNLAQFINTLNLASNSDFVCEIEKILNVESYLKRLALEVLVGDWDGYAFNKNNFYLYQNPTTGLFEYIEYDLDNTLGIDWLDMNWSERDVHEWSNPWEDRPLYERIMNVDVYREQYSYWLLYFSSQYLNTNELDAQASEYYNLIEDAAIEDEYRILDYGFSENDFLTAYEDAWGEHVPLSIQEYVDERVASLDWFVEDVSQPIALTEISDNGPQTESLIIKAAVIGQSTDVECSISVNNALWFSLPMSDDGLNADEVAEDGTYTLELNITEQYQHIEYQIVVSNSDLQISRPCIPNWAWASESEIPMVINELMSNNASTISDEAGEFDDWIELHNPTLSPINLNGLFLTDDLAFPSKWPLPDLTINQGNFILFWADGSEEQGPLHTNFGLSVLGEELALISVENEAPRLVDYITFSEAITDESYGREMDAAEDWVWFKTPTPDASNNQVDIIEDIELNFKYWPNPTDGKVSFSKAVTGIILDTHGREVGSFQNTQTIEVGQLAPGLYFIQVGSHIDELIIR